MCFGTSKQEPAPSLPPSQPRAPPYRPAHLNTSTLALASPLGIPGNLKLDLKFPVPDIVQAEFPEIRLRSPRPTVHAREADLRSFSPPPRRAHPDGHRKGDRAFNQPDLPVQHGGREVGGRSRNQHPRRRQDTGNTGATQHRPPRRESREPNPPSQRARQDRTQPSRRITLLNKNSLRNPQGLQPSRSGDPPRQQSSGIRSLRPPRVRVQRSPRLFTPRAGIRDHDDDDAHRRRKRWSQEAHRYFSESSDDDAHIPISRPHRRGALEIERGQTRSVRQDNSDEGHMSWSREAQPSHSAGSHDANARVPRPRRVEIHRCGDRIRGAERERDRGADLSASLRSRVDAWVAALRSRGRGG